MNAFPKVVVGFALSSRHLLAALAFLAAWPLAALLDATAERPLRLASASISCAFLRAAGIDVAREGTLLLAPSGRFDVLLPCSGGKFLAATLSLGFALVVLGKRTSK